jgi:hypothetical protein
MELIVADYSNTRYSIGVHLDSIIGCYDVLRVGGECGTEWRSAHNEV